MKNEQYPGLAEAVRLGFFCFIGNFVPINDKKHFAFIGTNDTALTVLFLFC